MSKSSSIKSLPFVSYISTANSNDDISIYDGLDDSIILSIEVNLSWFTLSPWICIIDDCVKEGSVLWVLCTTISAPCSNAVIGNLSLKPRWAPWASSTITIIPLLWA